MQVFNLTSLNSSQEVPKVIYKPINMNDESIFFEKILISLDDTWSEGIWAYDLATNQMQRIDQGQHVKYSQLYDFDTPYMYWNGTSKVDPNAMYFATITQVDEEDFIEFYQVDLLSGVQRSILGFKFDQENLMYKNMEVIAPGYLLFRLTYNMDLADSDFFDNMYLLDVEAKKYYEIQDEAFKINFGQRIVVGEGENAQLIMEEHYLSEEEQYEILTSDEIELAFDLPGGLDQDHIHKNAIKSAPFQRFLQEIIQGEKHLSFDIIDEIYQEGSLRVIGETEDNIYYKKKYYDFVLKDKGDFMSLRKMGSFGVYKINKQTLEKTFIRDIHGELEIKTNNHRAFTISPQKNVLNIVDFETEEIVYPYKKRYVGKANEEVMDFPNDEFIVVMLESDEYEEGVHYMIVDAISDEILIAGNDVLMLEDYLFII